MILIKELSTAPANPKDTAVATASDCEGNTSFVLSKRVFSCYSAREFPRSKSKDVTKYNYHDYDDKENLPTLRTPASSALTSW